MAQRSSASTLLFSQFLPLGPCSRSLLRSTQCILKLFASPGECSKLNNLTSLGFSRGFHCIEFLQERGEIGDSKSFLQQLVSDSHKKCLLNVNIRDRDRGQDLATRYFNFAPGIYIYFLISDIYMKKYL